ncbi:MAG: PAS domain-containing protein [Vicinamibacterales bacterium]
MTQLHTLTVRTNAALGRLADLERRAEHLNTGSTPVIRPALKELSGALEELQVANEHLQSQLEELGSLRARAETAVRRLDEFVRVVPLACVWTNQTGIIVEANDAAAALFNVARPRLAGKPLMLFFGDRQPFFDALHALGAPETDTVELAMLVRPRERRPRQARLTVHVLQEDLRWCWFVRPLDDPQPGMDIQAE